MTKLIVSFRNSAEVPKTAGLSAHSIKPALKTILHVALQSKLSIFYLKRDFNIFPVTEDMRGGPNNCTKKCTILH